jgi:hypothetical protein
VWYLYKRLELLASNMTAEHGISLRSEYFTPPVEPARPVVLEFESEYAAPTPAPDALVLQIVAMIALYQEILQLSTGCSSASGFAKLL